MKKNIGWILALAGIACVLFAIESSVFSPSNGVLEIETQTEILPNNLPKTQVALDSPTLSPILPNPNTNGEVFLNWTSVQNATYYNVYRDNSPFTTINNSILVGTTVETNLTDWIRTNGTYYYGVTALNYSVGESDISGNQVVIVEINLIPPKELYLEYSRIIGGIAEDSINGIAIDDDGNLFVVGSTKSSDLIVCNAYDDLYNGMGDVIIAKYSPTGALLWQSFFGGSNDDYGSNIAVDKNGNCIITGYTKSVDFPVLNARDETLNGGYDVFVAKFNSNGTLNWSSYYGGSASDFGNDIALNSLNDIYIIGHTNSSDLPMLNSQNPTFNGYTDMFVLKLNETGGLQWSTYYGDVYYDGGYGIAVDQDGNCYCSGYTSLNVFGYLIRDVKVVKYNSSGSMIWNNQIGNLYDHDISNDIAVDSNQNCYIVGFTTPFFFSSNNFPTLNAFDSSFNGDYDGFVTAFNSDGNVKWSTYLGGTNADGCYAISVDNQGNCYVTGESYSTNFPTIFSLNQSINGNSDLFLTRFNAAGLIISSSYFGGQGQDYGNCIVYDTNGFVYIGGFTNSDNFPIIKVDNSEFYGGGDGFILSYPWIDIPVQPTLNPIDLSCRFTGDIYLSWNAVDGATNYTIYRSTKYITTLNSSVDTIGTWNTTSVMDQVPDVGNFYYAIRASNASGYSNLSTCQNITVTYIVVKPPTLHPLDTIVLLSNSVHLTWNTSYRYTSFKIYRSTKQITSLSDAVYIGTTTSTGFYDTPVSAGNYSYVITALFNTFESVISNVQSTIINDIPQILASNLTFVKGIAQQFYEFSINDIEFNQTRLLFSIDGSLVANTTWAPNTDIKIPVDQLSIEIHTVTINVSDGYGGFDVLDYVINVIPNNIPQLTAVDKTLLLFFVDENFTLTWNVSDPNVNLPSYTLFCDQIPVSTGVWASGANITILLNKSSLGRYNYTLQVLDGYNGKNSSQITVVISLAINDEDGDGMNNAYERQWGLNPFYNDSQEDYDEDKLTNYQESLYFTNPFSADSDSDGINDWDEIFKYRTNPNNSDSDGDNYSDLMEIQWLSNPLSKWSTPVSNLVFWILLGISITVSTPLGIRRYKKERVKFNKFYPNLIRLGFIINLPKILIESKFLFFLIHCENRLRKHGFHKQKGTQNWFSDELWKEYNQIEVQIRDKEFIPVAVQMTKMNFEMMQIFGIPNKFLLAIKEACENEIIQVQFSNLNANLLKIIKGFDQTHKKLVGTLPKPNNTLSSDVKTAQFFLECRDVIIPIQEKLAYHLNMKNKIDLTLKNFYRGNWIQSAATLNQLRDEIESANPPYSMSLKTLINRLYQSSREFLASVHSSQIEMLHSLKSQNRFDLAIYSWLKYTQFKHTNPEDPAWQLELTTLLDLWKKQLESIQSHDELEKNRLFVNWLLHAFASQTVAMQKLNELKTIFTQ